MGVKQVMSLYPAYDIGVYNSYNVGKIKKPSAYQVIFYGEGAALRSKRRSRGKIWGYYDKKVLVHAGKKDFQGSWAKDGDFEDIFLNPSLHQMWGPGIVYEVCIPIALHLGVKSISTIGWELMVSGDRNNHFYDREAVLEDISKTNTLCDLTTVKQKFLKYLPFMRDLDNLHKSRTGKKYNITKPQPGESSVILNSFDKLYAGLKDRGVSLNVNLVDRQGSLKALHPCSQFSTDR